MSTRTAFTVAIGAVALVAAVRSVLPVIRKHMSTLADIPSENVGGQLGLPYNGPKKGKTAVVIGGSWSGMLAARVLLDHVDKVIILEAEDLGGDDEEIANRPQHRTRVMQFEVPHLMMSLAVKIVEQMLPSFSKVMLELGASETDQARHHFYNFGGKIRIPCDNVPGPKSYSASRQVIESAARITVLREYGPKGTSRVSFYDASAVRHLLLSDDKNSVRGVRYVETRTQQEMELFADIVVDASGRTAEGLKLMEKNGLTPPTVVKYDPLLWYSGVKYQRNSEEEGMTHFQYFAADSVKRPHRYVFKQQLEHGIGLIGTMCSGTTSIPIPKNIKEYEEFMMTASMGDLDMQRLFYPDGPVDDSKFKWLRVPPSRYVNYHECKTIPAGFFAVGDAICSVNPTYGQGLTVAAISASTLDSALRDSKNLIQARNMFFARSNSRLSFLWFIPLSQDMGYREIQLYPSAPRLFLSMFSWLVVNLSRAAHVKDDMSHVVWRVMTYEDVEDDRSCSCRSRSRRSDRGREIRPPYPSETFVHPCLLDHVNNVIILEAEDLGGDEEEIGNKPQHRTRVMQKIRIPSAGAPAGPKTFCVSRQVIESSARIAVLREHGINGTKRVRFYDASAVRHIVLSDDKKNIRGVRYVDTRTQQENEILADIVVDASGRSAEGFKLFEKNGLTPPTSVKYDPLVVYSGIRYKQNPTTVEGTTIFQYFSADSIARPHRFIMKQQVENGIGMIGAMASGTKKVLAPKTPEEYERFMVECSMGDTEIQRLFRPDGEITKDNFKWIKVPVSRFINYNDCPYVPNGFFSSGDAYCAVNPTYGQGLTIGALCASTMDAALRESKTLEQAKRKYFARTHSRLTYLWFIPLSQDMGYPEVQVYPSAPLFVLNTLNWLVINMSRAAHVREDMAQAFWKTLTYVAWPTDLFNPRIVMAIVGASFQGPLKKGMTSN
ncbi:hypothetical protein HDU97_002782 [Phlyctochytrium planicorne]|nr:hypothetical protein HDU97_002782 [Phlyctochytrium planicorne]